MDDEKWLGGMLRSHGLRKTAIRMKILRLFTEHEFALSARDIIAKLPGCNDRVTIYRALGAFEKQGILHRAIDDGHAVKYALCNKGRQGKKYVENHVHFTCEVCQQTYCLEDVPIPQVKLSEGFSISNSRFYVTGTCSMCNG